MTKSTGLHDKDPVLLFYSSSFQCLEVADAVFDPVPFLGPFGVVEPVEGPDQVAGDPPDPLEGGRFQLPGEVDVIPVYLNPDRLEAAAGEFLPQMADVGVNLLLGEGCRR